MVIAVVFSENTIAGSWINYYKLNHADCIVLAGRARQSSHSNHTQLDESRAPSLILWLQAPLASRSPVHHKKQRKKSLL